MTSIIGSKDTTEIVIVGHGIELTSETALDGGLTIGPNHIGKPPLDEVAAAVSNFADYAAVVIGRELPTFCLTVRGEIPGRDVVVRAWNSLWIFYLLSVSAGSICFPLYAVANGREKKYSSTNPHVFVNNVEIHAMTLEEVAWVKKRLKSFYALQDKNRFSRAVRNLVNSHFVIEAETKIMMLWAGIETLLGIEAELSYRIAAYASILYDGSADEKWANFHQVKKLYAVRSRVVHGADISKEKLAEARRETQTLLIGLLRRCLELGRVPDAKELDAAAIGARV